MSQTQHGDFFDPDRLRQSRQLASLTKKDLADTAGTSSTAISQYESGVSVPRTETQARLARTLNVPMEFFKAGRPMQRLESSETFFRSLRSTTSRQRANATSFAEQLWELSHALETHVRFPEVDLPTTEGDSTTSPEYIDPPTAALAIRNLWGFGSEPIPHLIRQLESRGIIVALAPSSEHEVARIDAFSTHAFGRPLMVLTPDRADDVFRHRFSAAHELGHLVLHEGFANGTAQLEHEADTFAAEFLTPSNTLRGLLPHRLDFVALERLSKHWGVSVKSLVYRSRELGLLSEATARRAYIRLSQEPIAPPHRAIRLFEGEMPSMLRSALELAEQKDVTVTTLADQLCWKPRRVRELLGDQDPRPELRLIPGTD